MAKKIYLAIILMMHLALNAQQMPQSKQYLINKASYIPAFTGLNGNIEGFMSYRLSWVGVEGAPKTAFFNINGALTDKMGLAITFVNEQYGNFSTTLIIPTYAFHLTFSENISLSLALSPLFYKNQINLSKITSHGFQVDPLVANANNLTVNHFDVGASFVFSAFNFNLGFYLPQTIAMASKFSNSSSTFEIKRQYNSFLSYSIGLNDFIFEPIATFSFVENSKPFYSGSIMVRYKNKIFSNIGYNADKSVNMSIGFLSSNSLVFKYNYEIGFSTLAKNSIGTHEFTIGFLIRPAKNFRQLATIFQPSSSNIQIDDKQIAMLEQKINTEKQERIAKDADLQRQLDSLKRIRITTSNNTTSTPGQIQYVQKILTYSIVFGFMNANILPSSYSELEKYTSKLLQDQDLRMKIVVYSDNMFNDQVNKQISQMRAKAVYDYISKQPGINPSQIQYEGMGSADPIADNTTPEGREKNNRVEFLFSKTVF